MTTKPILISIACVVVLIVVFLFVRPKNVFKPEKAEVTQFLYAFSNSVNEGNAKELLGYFDASKRGKNLKNLVSLLTGKKTFSGKGKPLADIKFNVDASDITIDGDIVTAIIPANFSHESFDSKVSCLILKIRKIAPNKFKIIQADARTFLTDYIVYENFVRSKALSDKDIYSDLTLQSFLVANKLKSQYDSVVWFSHTNGKSYFYVTKGKWDFYKGLLRDSIKEYKMGLVGPDLKEIIPVEYDLIHNINGTFKNVVEVEKDHKKGYYDLNGKNIVPVIYDQVFPINDNENLAVLRKGSDYYYLKNDYGISEKVDLKIADIISHLKQWGSFKLTNNSSDNVTEFNSREEHGSIYISPSYLVDLNILPAVKLFKNPLRSHVDFEDVSNNYIIKEDDIDNNNEENNNWIQAVFYSIRDYFLGGRSEFYDTKNIVVIDKKRNKVYSKLIDIDYTEGGDVLSGQCNEYSLNIINDSLFEVKATSNVVIDLYTSDFIREAPVYHYIKIVNDKLVELNDRRMFSFTKYKRIDDSYLYGCYMYSVKGVDGKFSLLQKDHLDADALRYMKNEIYADYNYKFKDTLWTSIFQDIGGLSNYKPVNSNVDDSLTVIDKYNLNWINNKLIQMKKTANHTLASK